MELQGQTSAKDHSFGASFESIYLPIFSGMTSGVDFFCSQMNII